MEYKVTAEVLKDINEASRYRQFGKCDICKFVDHIEELKLKFLEWLQN